MPVPRRQHGGAAEKRDDSRVVLIDQIAFGPPQSGPDGRISNWQGSVSKYPARLEGAMDVRFGSKADICSAPTHVCFTPNSDRESGFPQTVMSALPPKADMCSAVADVRFGP